MQWHIITGEYPPQPGGVSDYTYQLAKALAEREEAVHIWTAADSPNVPHISGVDVHCLPADFGFRWLRALHAGLKATGTRGTLLVQYVPHMYGWKSMNVAFCCWLAFQGKRRKLWVMFHEVAFPIKRGQPFKHRFLAIVHRMMAWVVLRSAKRSFTSIEPYREDLAKLAPNASVSFLRLFSNVPFSRPKDSSRAKVEARPPHSVVGVFSSFGPEICDLLEQALPGLLSNPTVNVLLVGPGEDFIQRFGERFPGFRQRLHTSGLVNALDAGSHIQTCEVLLQLYPDGASGARGTLIAALASGIPVVTTAGRLTEPILRLSGALAFADGDACSIREAVDNLLADKAAARSLGAAGRRLYESHFDVSVAVRTLVEGRRSTAALHEIARSA